MKTDFWVSGDTYSFEMTCPICEDWFNPRSEEISHKRASNTAHKLAEKKATEGLAGLEWEEVYAAYFPKIYRHEYKRNLEYEREVELKESVKRNENHPDVCGYHAENSGWMRDGSSKACMKSLRRKYDTSKWPNT